MIDPQKTASDMHRLMRELYPICRSITGNGVRKTLHLLEAYIPLKNHEIPTGTQVFDWTVPKEWNIKDAFIKNKKGERILDFRQSNLHVVSYSTPINKRISLQELKHHIHTLPGQPDVIPYRTAYYDESWGFCMSHDKFGELDESEYRVCIDATLEPGYLTYGEYYIPGKISDEVLISSHICHPSLCNDNLSGIALSTFLAHHLSTMSCNYSYRFLFIPVTIGSIAWLSVNRERADRIKHGLVAACVGDSGKFHYKKSRRGNAEIDKATVNVLKNSAFDYEVRDFHPYGYDERQYCSPGFNLPVGCLMRTPHGEYPEYHTSADDLDFVKRRSLFDSLTIYLDILYVVDNNDYYLNQQPCCEPQLGKRGLYKKIGGDKDAKDKQMALLWVLNLSDGAHSLLDISDRSGLAFNLIKDVADLLLAADLLQPVDSASVTHQTCIQKTI